MGTALVRRRSTASQSLYLDVSVGADNCIAEFRGPGVRHQYDHESPDEYELDLDQRTRGGFGNQGRIILLGDGTEVLTDSDDTDMFDHSEEDKDTENQVKKATPATPDLDSNRSEREGTPGPQEQKKAEAGANPTTIKAVADEDHKER